MEIFFSGSTSTLNLAELVFSASVRLSVLFIVSVFFLSRYKDKYENNMNSLLLFFFTEKTEEINNNGINPINPIDPINPPGNHDVSVKVL